MQWYMDHVCTYVPHLDLVDISQDMSATVRLMGTTNPVKKFQISRCYGPVTHTFSEMCPISALVKNFFISTLHTFRQPLD